jgi:hypothetical protein
MTTYVAAEPPKLPASLGLASCLPEGIVKSRLTSCGGTGVSSAGTTRVFDEALLTSEATAGARAVVGFDDV